MTSLRGISSNRRRKVNFTLAVGYLVCVVSLTSGLDYYSDLGGGGGDDGATGVDNSTSIISSMEQQEEVDETIGLLVNNTDRTNGRRQADEEELTLITFLQKAVKSYGQKKVAKSIFELANRDLYDLIWMLAGDLDRYLIFDLYQVYQAAQTDSQIISVYERFRAGNVNRTIVPEVFALDKKYDQFPWWQRVRGRMLNSVDKFMAGELDIGKMTPPPIEYDKDGKVIIAGVRIPDSSTISTIRRGESPGGYDKKPDILDESNDSDEDNNILDLLSFV